MDILGVDDTKQSPAVFTDILTKYYNKNLDLMLLTMDWGGYETRDIDILEDLGLIYGSFRCDCQGEERKFSRMRNGRWRSVDQIIPFGEFGKYLEKNKRLVRIIVNKISPRERGGIWVGGCSDRQLEEAIDPITVAKGNYHPACSRVIFFRWTSEGQFGLGEHVC